MSTSQHAAKHNDALDPDPAPFWDYLRIVGVAVPVIYVWSLPFLAHIGFAHKCPGYPGCKAVGASVSNFIVTPQATGAMAAAFFYPCLYMWVNAQFAASDRWVYPTLMIFQLFFGLFLMCPVNKVSPLHFAVVFSFCLAGITHFRVLLKYCAGHRRPKCFVLFCMAIGSFVGVSILGTIANIYQELLPKHLPFAFYAFEAIGMSSNAIFPMMWHLETNGDERNLPLHSSKSVSSVHLGD